MKNRKNILIVILFVSGILLYVIIRTPQYSFSNNKQETRNKPISTGHEGELLPEIDLLLTDSLTYVNTATAPDGKPIVLFYFAPYCPYCKTELNEIIKNMKYLKNIQFYLITPYFISDIKKFYEDNQLEKYGNVIIGRDYKFKFGDFFKTQNVPYLVIYTSNKKMNAAFIGNVKYDQIKSISEK
ncbi:thioredoxin fold domain-containing protein [Chitinophaga sp. CC14]|uniref:TlpA family protein disulfide reductase n=1 Tax=Chitinophaga sp. CC14 TaxID=3029199 RepID=UPI003B7C45EF